MQAQHGSSCKETVMGSEGLKNPLGEIMKCCVEQGKFLSVQCLQMTKCRSKASRHHHSSSKQG